MLDGRDTALISAVQTAAIQRMKELLSMVWDPQTEALARIWQGSAFVRFSLLASKLDLLPGRSRLRRLLDVPGGNG